MIYLLLRLLNYKSCVLILNCSMSYPFAKWDWGGGEGDKICGSISLDQNRFLKLNAKEFWELDLDQRNLKFCTEKLNDL